MEFRLSRKEKGTDGCRDRALFHVDIALVTSSGIRMVAVSPIGPGMTSLNPGSRRIKGIVLRVD